MKRTFGFAGIALLGACGGGDGDPDADLSRPDAPRPIDAAAVCAVESVVTEAPNPDPATGNTAALRVQVTPDPDIPGDDGERIEWNLAVTGTGALPDLFVFLVPYTAAEPNVPPADFNVDLPLQQACTATADYCMFLFADYDVTAQRGAQFFWPNTGTLRITQAGDVDEIFEVQTTAARFDEYDPATGEQLDSDLDGVSDCNGTLAAVPITQMTIRLPSAAAPGDLPAESIGGKWGQFTRPAGD